MVKELVPSRDESTESRGFTRESNRYTQKNAVHALHTGGRYTDYSVLRLGGGMLRSEVSTVRKKCRARIFEILKSRKMVIVYVRVSRGWLWG